MILTDYLLPAPSLQWQYASQAGVRHSVLRLPDDDTFDLTDLRAWERICSPLAKQDLSPLVIEPLPERLHRHIKLADAQRDESIETLLRMFPIMQHLGIQVLCFNFMAHVGWYRTVVNVPERGGALVTAFDMRDYPDDGTVVRAEQLWENLAYFLRAVVPAAEAYGIRLALHPDDPPVPRLGRVERILICLDAMDQAVNLVPSSHVGVTFCQGTFSAMGEDVCACIRHFGRRNKLFYVHFRDVVGLREQFRESFHDNGQTDMADAVRAYIEQGFAGPIRVDHVPTMAGEDNQNPGYSSVGRLFALGYLKGLLEANGAEIE